MKEKTSAARRVARVRGRKGGRPKTLSAEEVTLLQDLYSKKEVSIPEICQQLKISKMTLYRYVKPRESEKQKQRLSGFIRQLTGRRQFFLRLKGEDGYIGFWKIKAS
jgi:DNA invertase Pin-like site-specific DNA recombinase